MCRCVALVRLQTPSSLGDVTTHTEAISRSQSHAPYNGITRQAFHQSEIELAMSSAPMRRRGEVQVLNELLLLLVLLLLSLLLRGV